MILRGVPKDYRCQTYFHLGDLDELLQRTYSDLKYFLEG
jgi:hypothetical protein